MSLEDLIYAEVEPQGFTEANTNNLNRSIDRNQSAQTALGTLRDTGVAAAQGVVGLGGGLAGLAGLGIDAVANTNIGGSIFEGTEDLNNALNTLKTPEQLRAEEVAAYDDLQDSLKYDAMYAEETTTLGKANVRGKELLNSLGKIVDRPSNLTNVIGGTVGSLGLSGAITKGAVKGATKVAGKQLGKKATKAVEATTLTTLGVSDATSQAYNEVNSKNYKELLELDGFKQLVSDGLSFEEAKIKLAQEAGKIAATTNVGISAALALVGSNKLETGKLNKLTDITKDTITESAEEAGAKFSSNVGVQQTVEPDKQLTSGISQSVAEALVGTGVVTGGALSVGAGASALETAQSKVQDNLNQKESSNPTSVENIEKQINNTVQPEINANEADIQAANDLSIATQDLTEDQQIIRFNNEAKQIFEVSENEIKSDTLKNDVVKLEDENISLVRTISKFSVEIESSDSISLDKAEFIVDNLDRINSLGNKGYFGFDNNKQIVENIDNMRSAISNINQNKGVLKAKEAIKNLQQQDKIEDLTDNNGILKQEIVTNTVKLAKLNPAGVNADLAKTILNNEQNTLSKTEKAYLRTAIQIKDGLNDDSLKLVNNNLFRDTNEDKVSLNDYINTIYSGLKSGVSVDKNGEEQTVNEALENLGKLAQHFINKTNALNTNLETNENRTTFDQLDPKIKEFRKDSGSAFVNKKSLKSVNTAKVIFNEANAVVNAYNSIVENFFEGKEKLTVPKPHSFLTSNDNKSEKDIVTETKEEVSENNVNEEVNVENTKTAEENINNDTTEQTDVEKKVSDVETNNKEGLVKREPIKVTETYKDISNNSYLDKGFKLDTTNVKEQDKLILTGTKEEKSFVKTIHNMVKGFNKYLSQQLNTGYTKGKTNYKSPVEQYKSNPAYKDYKQGKIMSLLNQKENGLNEDIINKANLAVTDWFINLRFTSLDLSKLNIDGLYGESVNTAVYSKVKEDLAKHIEKFIGLKRNKDVPVNYSRGITESLADAYLQYLISKDVLFENVVKGDKKQILTLSLNPKSTEMIRNNLGNNLDIIKDAYFNEPENSVSYSTESITDIKKIQRNSNVSLTKRSQQAVLESQATPYKVNEPYKNFMNVFGLDNYKKLIGFNNIDEKTTNKYHLKSLEGENTTINYNMFDVSRMLEAAKEKGELYYKYVMTSVGRLQQEDNGGQANKIARELFQPNQSELDLTNQEHIDMFWLTTAQGLEDSSLKVEQLELNDVVFKAQDIIENQHRNKINLIKDYLKTDKFDSNAFLKEFNKPTDNVVINTLFNVARFELANENKDKVFTHYVPLELDGKTNGFANYIVNFSLNNFDTDWVNTVGKVGLYIGEGNKSLNNHVLNKDSSDVYQTVATNFEEILTDNIKKHIKDYPQFKANISTFVKVVTKYLDIEMTKDGLKVGRKTTKNPMTTFIYGSKEYGTSNKITGTLLSAFHEEATAIMQGKSELTKEQLYDAVNLISEFKIGKNKTNKVSAYKPKNTKLVSKNTDLKDFTIPVSALQNLESNVEQLFVQPLYASMQSIAGDAFNTFDNLKYITQEQTKIAIDIFKENLENIVNNKKKKGIYLKNDLPSENDMNEAIKSVQDIVPSFKSSHMNIGLTYKEQATDDNTRISSGIDGRRETEATLPTIRELGVQVQPNYNIALGDGLMIQNWVIDNPELGKRSEKVFDGVYVGATDIKEAAPKINKAVYDSWTQNKILPILKSVETAYKNVVKPEHKETLKPMITFLKKKVIQNQARINTLKKAEISVDQMAGGSNPYYREGKLKTIEELQDNYNKELDKLSDKVGFTSKNRLLGIQSENPKLVKQLKQNYENSYEFLSDLINSNTLNKDQHEIVNQLADVLRNYKVLIKPTDKYLRSKDLNKIADNVSEYGLTDTRNKIIVINNVSPETIIHELIHAHVATTINEAVITPKKASKPVLASIALIERSIESFIKKDYSLPALQNLKNVLQNASTRQEAINEFLAWGLTNKDVIKSLKETKVQNTFGVKRLFKIAFTGLNRILNAVGIKMPTNMFDRLEFTANVLFKEASVRISKERNHTDKYSILKQEISKNITRNDINKVNAQINKYEELNALYDTGYRLNEEELNRFKKTITLLNLPNIRSSKALLSLANSFKEVLKKSDNLELTKLLTNLPDKHAVNIFVGLYFASKQFKDTINTIKIDDFTKTETIDEKLDNLGNKFIKELSSYNTGSIGLEVSKAIDELSELNQQHNNIKFKNRQFISNETERKVIEKSAKFIESLGFKGSKALSAYIENKDIRDKQEDDFVNLVFRQNKIPTVFKELLKDVMGKTLSTESVEDMVNVVKKNVALIKTNFKNKIPKHINKLLKDTSIENRRILGKLILENGLVYNDSVENIINLLSKPESITKEINSLEKELDSFYIKKSKQLALFMNNKTHSNGLLYNAYAIASKLGTVNVINPKQELVDKIDKLVSLYAFKNSNDKQLLIDEVKNNKEGISNVLSYIQDYINLEKDKLETNIQKYNYFKGYTPILASDNRRVKLDYKLNHTKNLSNGFVYLGEDKNNKTMGYYYTDVDGTPYQQGVLQTVSKSVMGVNPNTGLTLNGSHQGFFKNPKNKNNMKAVYGNDGKVIGYEKFIEPKYSNKLQSDTDISELIAVMKSRQIEEQMADEFNYTLIDRINEDYNASKNKDNFVNVKDNDDPIIKEIWKVIPQNIKDYISSTNEDGFYVRKAYLNNALGYRKASVAEIFNKRNNLNKELLDKAEQLFTAMFGSKAYEYLVRGEKALQNTVQSVKETIIVRSGIVMVGNILSNMSQLSMYGIDPITQYRNAKKYIAELNQHMRHNDRVIEISFEKSSTKDKNKLALLDKELNIIKEQESKFGIKPLLDSGEFNTIAEDLSDNNNKELLSGKYTDWIESKLDTLPDNVKTLAKYAYISKDTSLFKGLEKTVLFSDFVAKATLHNHLMNQGKSLKEANSIVSEAFINYNFVSGRTRDYLESIGLVWFFNYKLRILKSVKYLLLNNPLSTLLNSIMLQGLPLIEVDTPLNSNVIASGLKGELKYAVGPEMLEAGLNLNPWVNITK